MRDKKAPSPPPPPSPSLSLRLDLITASRFRTGIFFLGPFPTSTIAMFDRSTFFPRMRDLHKPVRVVLHPAYQPTLLSKQPGLGQDRFTKSRGIVATIYIYSWCDSTPPEMSIVTKMGPSNGSHYIHPEPAVKFSSMK